MLGTLGNSEFCYPYVTQRDAWTVAKALTTRTVEALKPNPRMRLELPDPALSGLYIIVQPSGTKSWALRYRHAGRTRKLTLGRWPIVGVAAARAAATEALEKIEHGKDPAAEKMAAKAASADLAGRDTLRALFDLYTRQRLSKLKAGETARLVITKHVLPHWGDRNVQEITRRDVIDLLEGIVESGRAVTANRTRAYLSAFFNWCVERDVIELSPVAGTRPPAKETARHRVLSDDEIRWLWQAANEVGQPFGPLAQLLLLTGQRRGEVAEMRDAEIDGDKWHLEGTRTKNGYAHTVPLSSEAKAVLAKLERINGREGYIFTTTGVGPVSGFTKGHARLVKTMQQIAGHERSKLIEIPRWTLHDLRRTAATGMARLGIPVRVTEAVLNHASGTGGGIVAVYQRHDFAGEKRNALDAWGRYVHQLVDSASSQVVQTGGRPE